MDEYNSFLFRLFCHVLRVPAVFPYGFQVAHFKCGCNSRDTLVALSNNPPKRRAQQRDACQSDVNHNRMWINVMVQALGLATPLAVRGQIANNWMSTITTPQRLEVTKYKSFIILLMYSFQGYVLYLYYLMHGQLFTFTPEIWTQITWALSYIFKTGSLH